MTNLLSKASAYGRNQLKSGNTGLKLVVETVEHYRDHGDWRPMSRLLKGMEHSPSDFSKMRVLLGRCLDKNVVMRKDDEHAEKYVFRKKDDKGTTVTNNIGHFVKLAEEGYSFRSKEVQDFVKPEKKQSTFDRDAYLKRVAAKLVKENVDMSGVPQVLMLAIREALPAHNPEDI